MEEDFWRRRLGLWDATASKLFNQFLVGGFKHVLFSIIHTYLYIWDVILPIDELICFKMFIAPPSSHYISIVSTLLVLKCNKSSFISQ